VAFLDGHVKWMRKEAMLYNMNGACNCSAQVKDTDPRMIWNRF
jgi:hypothetical protein